MCASSCSARRSPGCSRTALVARARAAQDRRAPAGLARLVRRVRAWRRRHRALAVGALAAARPARAARRRAARAGATVFTAHDVLPRRSRDAAPLWAELYGNCERVIVHGAASRDRLLVEVGGVTPSASRDSARAAARGRGGRARARAGRVAHPLLRADPARQGPRPADRGPARRRRARAGRALDVVGSPRMPLEPLRRAPRRSASPAAISWDLRFVDESEVPAVSARARDRAPLPLDRGLRRARDGAGARRAAGRHRRGHLPRAVRAVRPRLCGAAGGSCGARPGARACAHRPRCTDARAGRHGAGARGADLGADGADDARALRTGARGRGRRLASGLAQPVRTSDAAAAHPVAPWDACACASGSSRCSSARSPPAPRPRRPRHPARSRSRPARAAAPPRRPRLGCTAARGLDDARAVALAPTGRRSTSPRPRPRPSRRSTSMRTTAC